jgi:predicted signal transduction protein with EAL and GGDEF domain/DNA-binding response OmpR family regulator
MNPHAELGAEPSTAARVLLVDDDEVNLLLTSIALRERGFEVLEATGGEAALQSLADCQPDILVLDAQMPGLDGFETCRELRKLPGFESLPVLMLTGLDDEASILKAYEAGATDFFVKSTQWSLLTGRLRNMLRSARTLIELERSKSKLARAQDLARMGSFEWRRDRRGLMLSMEALRVFGVAANGRLDMRDLIRMVPSEQRRDFVHLLRRTAVRTTVLATDFSVSLFDGRERVIHVEAEPEFNEFGQLLGYAGIVQDVTDRRVAEDKIRHLANFDALTSLPNRRQLIWRAERAVEQARRGNHQVGLLLIDLDRFKLINDTLGHSAGDELLVEVSRRLRSCVRHSELMFDSPTPGESSRALTTHRALEAVGRLGGDEFVALLPEVGSDADAERVAQRVLDVMREAIFVAGQECFVTASVGIALFPRDGITVADVLRNADVAMYSAKAAGRNAASLYMPHLAGQGRRKLELESALHKAIEREELVLHYQPKIDVRNAQIVGVEALMRWNRGGQLVPPGDFIPMAEETGLIVPMSEWAIREAMRQARVWRQKHGIDISIAVNLPSLLIERTDLIAHIEAAAAEHGLSPRALQIEITETGLMKDRQEVIGKLYALNAIGVDIAIDDFGTGYSSLAYLPTLPIAELKIDRSFVQGLGVKMKSRAVVTAILALAHSLRLRVVAEGVETLGQMQALQELGCHTMQGFLFSRPIPPDDLDDWLQRIVLPRKAPWIAHAEEVEVLPPVGPGADFAGLRPYRAGSGAA